MDLISWSFWKSQVAQISLFHFLQFFLCQVLLVDLVKCRAPDFVLFIFQKLSELLLVKVLHHIPLVIIDGGFAEGNLGDLPLVNLVLHGVCRNESVDDYVSFLADSIAPVDRLIVVGRIPIGIEDDRSVSRHKIQTNPRHLRGEKEAKNVRIVIEILANSVS